MGTCPFREVATCHKIVDRRARQPRHAKQERTAIINIRVKPEEKDRFAKAADEAGMDVSTFMLSATIEKIERRSRGEGA